MKCLFEHSSPFVRALHPRHSLFTYLKCLVQARTLSTTALFEHMQQQQLLTLYFAPPHHTYLEMPPCTYMHHQALTMVHSSHLNSNNLHFDLSLPKSHILLDTLSNTLLTNQTTITPHNAAKSFTLCKELNQPSPHTK